MTQEPHNPSKQKLSQFLTDELAKRSLTQDQLAAAVGCAPSTLRSYLHRNAYPRELIARIAAVLGLSDSINESLNQLSFQFVKTQFSDRVVETLYEAFEQTDQSRSRLEPAFRRHMNDLETIYSNINFASQIVIFTATVIPDEAIAEVEPLRTAFKEAVTRGARFDFCYPKQEVINAYADTWGYRRLVSEAEFKEAFDTLVADAQTPEAQGRIFTRACDDNPYFVPGFQFIGFRSDKVRRVTPLQTLPPVDRAAVRLPELYGGTIFLHEHSALTDRLFNTLRAVVRG